MNIDFSRRSLVLLCGAVTTAALSACDKLTTIAEHSPDVTSESAFISIRTDTHVAVMGAQSPITVYALLPSQTATRSVTFSANYKGVTFVATGGATEVVRAVSYAPDTMKVIAQTRLILIDTAKVVALTDTQYVIVRATIGASGGSAGFYDTTTVKFVPSPPTIILSPDSTAFAMAAGVLPMSQTIGISNGGSASLTGLAVAAPMYAAGQATGWLTATLSASSSTAPTTVTLTIAASAATLPYGTYAAAVPVTSTARGVTGSRRILVSLLVAGPTE